MNRKNMTDCIKNLKTIENKIIKCYNLDKGIFACLIYCHRR